jgi:hypothetical protein
VAERTKEVVEGFLVDVGTFEGDFDTVRSEAGEVLMPWPTSDPPELCSSRRRPGLETALGLADNLFETVFDLSEGELGSFLVGRRCWWLGGWGRGWDKGESEEHAAVFGLLFGGEEGEGVKNSEGWMGGDKGELIEQLVFADGGEERTWVELAKLDGEDLRDVEAGFDGRCCRFRWL